MQKRTDDTVELLPELTRLAWSPMARVTMGLAGVALTALALRSRGFRRYVLGSVGLGAAARAATNLDFARLIGMLTIPVIHLRRSIEVNAPIADVYDFWSRFENYPRFMSHVKKVTVNEQSSLTWILAGPAKVPMAFDAVVTALQRDQLIGWRSLAGSPIINEGRIRFRECDGFRTCVDVDLLYAPPAGALGYAIVQLLGFNPRSTIDADLARMRDLVEERLRAAPGPSNDLPGDFHHARARRA